jgi:MraZ protein
VFTGEYHHSIDEKGRLAVPFRFRARLADGGFVSKWIDGCLSLWPRDEWDALAAKVATLPIAEEGSRWFQRHIFGTAFEMKLDRQGRFLVPAVLRTSADLGTEAVILGARDHLEIWSPERWAAISAQMDQPEVLAKHLTGLGI